MASSGCAIVAEGGTWTVAGLSLCAEMQPFLEYFVGNDKSGVCRQTSATEIRCFDTSGKVTVATRR
jgi:hypothetical protein